MTIKVFDKMFLSGCDKICDPMLSASSNCCLSFFFFDVDKAHWIVLLTK